MKISRNIVVATTMVVSALCLAADDPLDSFKKTYETEVQKIRGDHVARLSGLLDSYGKSLDTAIEILRRKGDPDPVLIATAEKDRFGRDKTVPNPPADDLPAELQDIQRRYIEAVKVAEVEKGKCCVSLTEKYVAALDRLMKAYTAEDKLDLALNVKSEKERAEFILADVEVQLKAAAEREKQQAEEARRREDQARKGAEMSARRTRLPDDAKDAVEWNGHFYKLYPQRMTWHEGKKWCADRGGHLVYVTSEDEHQFINTLRGGRSIWMGATDEKKEGDWQWLDGTKVKWLRNGGPSPFGPCNGKDDYLQMFENGSWDDITTTYPSRTICEWDL